MIDIRNCPKCNSKSTVKDSRPSSVGVRRRRACKKCKYRWTTYEIKEKLWKAAEKMLKVLYGKRIFDEL